MLVAVAERAEGGARPAGPLLEAMARGWEQEALRSGARWFGIACMCLPVLDVLDAYSVMEAVLAGARAGAWPEVALRVWAMLLWVIAAGAAAGRLMGWLAPGWRMPLWTVCALLHAGYAVASGARLTALVAAGCFALSLVRLRGARGTWPMGQVDARQ